MTDYSTFTTKELTKAGNTLYSTACGAFGTISEDQEWATWRDLADVRAELASRKDFPVNALRMWIQPKLPKE